MQPWINVSYLIACDIAELVDGDVLVEVGLEGHALPVARGLQHPDLLLLEGLPVGVGAEAEGLGAEVLELGVDQPDRPAALLRGRGRAVRTHARLAVEARHRGDWKEEDNSFDFLRCDLVKQDWRGSGFARGGSIIIITTLSL